MTHTFAQAAYIVAAALFVFSLYWMNSPKTARRAVFAGVAGMLLAVVATWVQPEVVNHGWIIIAIIAGFIVGIPLSLVPLTAVPQRTALSHAFGGLALRRGRRDGRLHPCRRPALLQRALRGASVL